MDIIRYYAKADLHGKAGAIHRIEIDGDSSSLDNSSETIQQAATNDGQISFETTTIQEQVDKLLQT